MRPIDPDPFSPAQKRDELRPLSELLQIDPRAPGADKQIWFRQRKATLTCLDLLDAAVMFLGAYEQGLVFDKELCAESRAAARNERKHITWYMRQPQHPSYPQISRQIGGRLDRLFLLTANTLEAAVDLYELPEKLRVRRELQERSLQRREQRLKRRKHNTSPVMAPPPVPVSKREKREEAPRCDKCGKRPRVSGTLCEPCARWLMRS